MIVVKEKRIDKLNNRLKQKQVNFQLLNNKKIHSNIFKYYKQLHQRNTCNIA